MNISNQSWLPLLEVFVIAILPVVLIQSNIVSSAYRIQLYSLMYGLAIPLVFLHRLTLHDLNIRLDNFWEAGRLFSIEAMIVIIGGLILAYGVEYRIETGVGRVVNPLQYVFVSVPIQQFIFFGFIYNRLTQVTDNKLIIGVAITLLFGASHLPWNNLEFTLVALGMGTMWSAIYVFTPNLIWSFTLHLIIGLFSLVIVQLN